VKFVGPISFSNYRNVHDFDRLLNAIYIACAYYCMLSTSISDCIANSRIAYLVRNAFDSDSNIIQYGTIAYCVLD